MGNRESSAEEPSSCGSGSGKEFYLHCKDLYAQLRSSVDDSNGSLTFKDGFASLFGGSSKELGRRLHLYLFGDSESSGPCEISCDAFIVGLEKLRTVLLQDRAEISKYIISLFLTSSSLESDLQILLHAAVSCALHVGLGFDLFVPPNHPLLSAVISAIVEQQHDVQLDAEKCEHWIRVQAPHILTGLIQWLRKILSLDSGTTLYHLPKINCKPERLLQLNILMWTLSCVLPTVFLGATRDVTSAQKNTTHEDLPSGGTWTCLYSSKEHGFSMNRFQHHCFDYKQPSIMLVECSSPEGQAHTQVLAMDSEWRDGTYFFGGMDFCFIQLQPVFSFLKRGAKLVSLNEKQRGFPTGLRVMSSDRHQCCVFELKSSLDEARLHEGDWLKVESVEVWGCGGTQAAEMQQRIKEWEAKEVLRRREVHRKQHSAPWEDDPDRFLLELGGVSTARPRENM